jgi:general secretion pathway protein H
MKCRNSSCGFSLVEMLVVLGIVGLIAALSVPYSRRSGQARGLDATAQTVAAGLREAQTEALDKNRESVITLDLQKRQLRRMGNKRVYEVPSDIEILVLTAENEVRKDNAAFRFFPDGGSTGGKITLSRASVKREISINWLTGAVAVSAGEVE